MMASGKLTASDLLEASSRAIGDLEDPIGAWVSLALTRAADEARGLDRKIQKEGALGPLHGVPVGIKDIFDTAALPTEWGAPTKRNRQPERDCALVARLRDLGCIVIGKTVTTAFAYFDTGPTRNPANLAHTPGGSSSGSAAAVAAGMVPLAVGSQTQGSVLRPASFCGVTGFKPGFGVLPLAGVMPFAPSLDHAGLFCRTPSDMRVAWRALGFEHRSRALDTLTTIEWPPAGGIGATMRRAVDAALAKLAAEGVQVRAVPRPAFFDDLPDALFTVMAAEAASVHGEHYRQHGPLVGAKLASLLDQGMRIGRREYRAALATLEAGRARYSKWAAEHPIVATPAATGTAPRGLGSSGDPRCNAPFTALGAPAISIPAPVGAGQLPAGIQLTAGRGQEAALLASAAAWHRLLHGNARAHPGG